MPAPSISALPPAPSRSSSPATFATDADTFVAALPGLVSQANALAAYLDGLIGGTLDSDLAAIAALSTTTFGRSLLTMADAAAVRTAIGAGTSLATANEWAPNFTAAGDVYIPAVAAMTISQGNAAIGTGTLTFAKSTTAAPGTFTSTTLPATLQSGAWLRVTAASITGFVATHLVRTA